MTVALLALTGLLALGDWAAVARAWKRFEYFLKPLTLAALIAAAASASLGAAGPWLVAALAFGLQGDVALMFAADDAVEPDLPFLLGLGAFLVGHALFLVAFVRHGLHAPALIVGAVLVAGAAGLSLPRVLAGARRAGGIVLAAIVAAYAVLLAVMVVLAIGTGVVPTAVGGALFLASDTTLAWERFVRRLPHGPVVVIATYHLAQLLIVIGLVRRG